MTDKRVALLAEGVDRNSPLLTSSGTRKTSPSSRRAWIEIAPMPRPYTAKEVALLAEGVDRNIIRLVSVAGPARSPSSRRAWIEMKRLKFLRRTWKSPSSRRAWIEIGFKSVV